MCVLLLFTALSVFLSFYWVRGRDIYKHSQSLSWNFFSTHTHKKNNKYLCTCICWELSLNFICVFSHSHPYHVIQILILFSPSYKRINMQMLNNNFSCILFDTVLPFDCVTYRSKPLSNWWNLINIEAYMLCLISILCQ